MPNQNPTEVKVELNMAHCDVCFSYPPCKVEDRLCRISYRSPVWCPTCDKHSPCKRSKSESEGEPCRRRSWSTKGTSKKYDWIDDQECENMDLEYAVKDTIPGAVRWDRVRSNLCELPTTYISNNCLKVSNQDYLDTNIEKTFKTSETNPNFGNTMVERQDKISKFLPKIDESARTINGIASKMKQIDAKKFKSVIAVAPHYQHSYSMYPDEFNMCSPRSMFSDSHQLADLNYCDDDDQPSIYYDTCNFFDKKVDVANLREQYGKEVEILKERLQYLKQNGFDKQHKYVSPIANQHVLKLPNIESYSDKITKLLNTEFAQICDGYTDEILKDDTKTVSVITEDKQHPMPKELTSVSKISVKTKTKLLNSKVRKQKIKTVVTKTECSDSECSDSEASIKDFQDSESSDSSTSSSKDLAVTPSGSGDSLHWPIRPSLFPYIPPYISFVSHDSRTSQTFPIGARHLKWKLSTITPILVRNTLLNSGFRLVRKSNEWVGTWGKHMKSPMFQTLKETQKLNHFPGTFHLGRKDRLWRNINRHINRYGLKEFGFTPQTYILPQDLKILKQHWQNKGTTNDEKYIIKPPAAARGTGIKVINRWSQLPKRMALVVQEYISRPYLINKSKFDLRLYVLVTSFNPLRIYLYPEGLARFASVPYSDDPKDLKDRFMHLTNYSINKLSAVYAANEDANSCKGHKWTLTKLWEYMAKRGINTKALWKNLQQLVIKTMITAESSVSSLCRDNINNRYNSYELFGVDVLLDEHLKCWLLEVNISPSLHSQSSLDEHVKGPLVRSLFNLVQFHLPPKLKRSDTRGIPPCYDPRIYTTTLTKKEITKHNYFCQVEFRNEYLEEILNELTGDDIRFLTQAEDELTVIGEFQRIFPTAQTHKYFNFMEIRYYNRLFDAWENRYEKNRDPGILILQSLCELKLHLKIAPPTVVNKNLPNLTPSVVTPIPVPIPSTEGQTQNVITNAVTSPILLETEKPLTLPPEVNPFPNKVILQQQATINILSSLNHMAV